MNGFTLKQSKFPISSLEIAFKDGLVQLHGTLHKVVAVPFSATATLLTTTQGDLQLHLTKITAAGLLHKKLLDMLGLNVAWFSQAQNSAQC